MDSRTEMWLFKFETVERARRAEIRDRPFVSSNHGYNSLTCCFEFDPTADQENVTLTFEIFVGILVIGTYHWVNQWKQTENADWDSQLIYVNTFLK